MTDIKKLKRLEELLDQALEKIAFLEAELRTERLSKQAEARRRSWGNGAVRQ